MRVGLAPDEDFAVVGGGGQDVAVFGVGPGYGPDGTFVAADVLMKKRESKVTPCKRKDDLYGSRPGWPAERHQERESLPFQSLGETVCFSLHFEDLDSSVGGAGCETATVVVEDCIVL